jgi:hypothetical protein
VSRKTQLQRAKKSSASAWGFGIQDSRSWDSAISLLVWLATCVAVISFLAYYQRGKVMLYGDAVAHINIARRVFDSKTPGLLQLGTVWLPLPHLVMIPFLLSKEMWQRGVGGSMPSLIGYVFAVAGMFRLLRGALSRSAEADAPAFVAACAGTAIFALNPNLIYMQTTAMGESLYLAFFIWTVVYFSEAIRGESNALTKCGGCLAAASLTRYDGWFLAVAMAMVIIYLALRNRASGQPTSSSFRTRTAAKFVLIAAIAPILWLAYNGIVYRNPLEFANGPYSAKAIEARTQSSGNAGHPGSGNLVLAGMYFVKAGEANVAENQWLQRGWILLGVAGLALLALQLAHKLDAGVSRSRLWPLLFLGIPIPFYALSVAYSGVPIFIPAWWPFTHYNVRYGLQLLPALAAALSIIMYRIIRADGWKPRLRLAAVLSLLAFVAASYGTVWHADPICLQEAEINMRTRNQFEVQVAGWLKKLPPDCTLLMYLGDHVGAVQQAGLPLKQTINEGNHRVWKRPVDPDGLWERALADPAHYTDYVLAFDGDPVWQAVQGKNLQALVEIHVTGQARAILYRAR